MTSAQATKKPYQIVVGFDFSDLAERAVAEAVETARLRAPAELHVVTVVEPDGVLLRLPGDPVPMTEEAAREAISSKISKIIAATQTETGPAGVDRVALYVLPSVPAGEPGKLITDLARAVDANLIVVGTHGRRGVARLLLGSVAAQVVRDAGTNVTVVRPADFVHGHPVPAIEPPLRPGEPHLKQFEHRRTYHYVDKVSAWTSRTMPVS